MTHNHQKTKGDERKKNSRVLFDENLAAPEELRCLNGGACMFSRRSPAKDTANEDSAAVRIVNDSAALLVVADGCGGMAGGERASRIAVEALLDSIDSSSHDSATMRPAILDGIEAANRAVRAIGTGAATTLAAVELRNETIRSYHIGDSTVLLVGNRGKIKLLTRAHAPVAYGVEAGLIHEEDAIHHEDLHLVSNVVGTADTHIEIGPERTMSPRDTLLLASDGLFDNLRVDEIVEIIRKGPLREAALQLIEKIEQRMRGSSDNDPSKPDDATFILFRPRREPSDWDADSKEDQ